MQEQRQRLEANPARFVEDFIKDFVQNSPANRLKYIDGSPIFVEPLVGFASGQDPLLAEYKKIIGEHHLTPQEAMEKGGKGTSRSLSLICWALPIALETKKSNRQEKQMPSRRWAHTRTYGEQFNDTLRRAVADMLEGMGYPSVAPVASPFYTMSISRSYANWSERHMLYTAGLGTFSLNDGFITPKGIAMRCGSVVTTLELPTSPRPFKDHMSNCPFMVDGSCGRCIDRCPGGAITAQGHDKNRCFDHMKMAYKTLHEDYQVEILGCGLCQTRVPCEMAIPKGKIARS